MIVLLLYLIRGDDSPHNAFSKEDCKQNWAICLIYNGSYVKNTNRPNVKIAVLDSGINSQLDILKGKVTKSYNAIDDAIFTKDEFGHGTMIASIIASNPNPHTIIGVNPNVELYDVQVLNNKGTGKIEHIVKGINWSIEKNVDIINLSFGFSKDDPRLKKVINLALSKNIIIVASAGNTLGLSTDFPAKYEGVYSISAIDKDFNKYKLAAKGKIDYVTPGVNVPVINHMGERSIESGTSFATAYATGIMSLGLAEPNIEITTKDLHNKDIFGEGLLQIQ
ncbi:S8 family serine peptidase [Lysinibacillus varians]|uniref:Chromosome partitioning protein ParA n=1 Tax=Lysinibacillus varians TaxID=1145276 RepID=A0ABY2T6Z1_9BACI|nr:S8 family serine peptidase [Lysinibacillus varians]TKI59885.1 chromosome partitioning protein ParA [Lysinibacillus varians]